MSTITFDYGGSALSYECQRAGHAEPRRAGSKQASFAQRLTSGIREEFMVVPLILQRLTASQAAAVRTLFANGEQVPCRGDVFNVGAVTVICSATITDEVDETDTWWTLTITLYEVGANLDYTPTAITLYLTHVAAGGGSFVASTDPADDPSGVYGAVTIMDAPEVIPTCGNPMAPNPLVSCPIGYSAAAEAIWESPPAPADGTMVGAPVFGILSIGGTADCWNTQAVKVTVYQVRGGSDIAQFDTGYTNGNGGFAGGSITATAVSGIVWAILAGDTLRVEMYGRAGLHSGYSSDGTLQVTTFGNLGGAAHLSSISYRGTALFQ